jgi:opacity protein-like surface antigen
MKKLLLSLLLVAGCFGVASAQGLFIRVGGGYNLGINQALIGQNATMTTSTSGEIVKLENVYGSHGQGINLGLRVGYMFSENVGADLGLNYILGAKYSFTDKTTTPTSVDETKDERWANTLLINPCMVLSTSQKEMISAYTRFGIAIGMPSVMAKGTQTSPGITREDEREVSMAVGLGFTGALGVDIHFGDRFGVYGELNLLSMSSKANSVEITKYTLNGKDRLNDIPADDRKFNYVDEIETKPGETPKDQLRAFTIPFSALGINVGLKIRF